MTDAITRVAHEMHLKRVNEARLTIRREATALALTDDPVDMQIRSGRIAQAISDLKWYSEKAAGCAWWLEANS